MIERAKASYLAELLALDNRSVDHDPFTRATLLVSIRWRPGGVFYYQDTTGHPAGLIAIEGTTGRRFLTVRGVCVAPECRRRGIASQLLDFAEELALRMGTPRLELEVRSDNEAAIACYERYGFFQARTLRSRFGSGLDGLRLRKLISTRRRDAA